MTTQLADDIWCKVFIYLPPIAISIIRCCSKHFSTITDPHRVYMSRYWKHHIKIAISEEQLLDFINIPDECTVTNWFYFYLEWIKVLHFIAKQTKKRNYIMPDESCELPFYYGKDPYPSSKRFVSLCLDCAQCNCLMVYRFLTENKFDDVCKQTEQQSLSTDMLKSHQQ